MFFPNSYSTIGYFLSDLFSKIRFLFDFYSSSFVHSVTTTCPAAGLEPPLRMKHAYSYSACFGGGGGGLFLGGFITTGVGGGGFL